MMISNTISIVIYSYHQDGVFIKSACQKQLKKRRDCDDDVTRCGLGTYENLVFLFVLKSTI